MLMIASIDEALRLAASGQPPAGYFERLQRRIAAAPETHRVRGALWLWIPAGCAVAAVFLAVILPMLLHSSKPERIAAVRESNIANLPAASRANLPPSRTKAHALTVSRPRLRHQKARRVATRDAANLFDYPLTHQEKLLVEFARTATPDELKELNPEYQAKMEAKQEAEFAAYLKSGEFGKQLHEQYWGGS